VRGRGRVLPIRSGDVLKDEGGAHARDEGGQSGGQQRSAETSNLGPQNFHIGLGGTIFSEQTGPISYNGVSGSFSGHIRIKDELKLSIGAALELLNYRLDPTTVQLLDDNDIAVNMSRASFVLPSINAGIALYSRSFFISAASRQLLQNRVQLNDQNPFVSGLEIHYIATAGYRVRLSEDVSLLPSATLRFISPAPSSFDLSLQADFKDLFFLGASYRHNDAVVGMLGFNLNHILRLNYSYDYTISNLSNYSSGTHGIVLALRLGYEKSGGRRYFW
ncbi:MAG: PorP/SprF family type IX secretion system membrane protein, partial [Bacteroidota bacterium]